MATATLQAVVGPMSHLGGGTREAAAPDDSEPAERREQSDDEDEEVHVPCNLKAKTRERAG